MGNPHLLFFEKNPEKSKVFKHQKFSFYEYFEPYGWLRFVRSQLVSAAVLQGLCYSKPLDNASCSIAFEITATGYSQNWYHKSICPDNF